jgi:hypothetical protein
MITDRSRDTTPGCTATVASNSRKWIDSHAIILFSSSDGGSIKEVGSGTRSGRFLSNVKVAKPHLIAVSQLLTRHPPEGTRQGDAIPDNLIASSAAIGGRADPRSRNVPSMVEKIASRWVFRRRDIPQPAREVSTHFVAPLNSPRRCLE